MLSYQHGYHAGNFADVIKHLVLVHLLDYLTQKDKPLFYLDTHAGRGDYDLKQGQSQRTLEYKTGILPVWNQRDTLPKVFSPYFKTIESLNPPNHLQRYPGSPYFAIQHLRQSDRIYLCEAHPQEYDALLQLPRQNKRVHVSPDSGWDALKSLLPPPEKRGLIFIDPSFEIKDEYQSVPKQLNSAYEHFPQGVYCLWYPMTPSLSFQSMTQKLESKSFEKTFNLEFFLTPQPGTLGMYGLGLWIINPPYSLEKTIKPALDALTKIFHPKSSGYVMKMEL
jgi:23S rRNA (adenine2030-N6)-methyltransferase